MDIVTIFLHGRPQTWDRDEAIPFFSRAVRECDGSERDRYALVLAQLVDGCLTCFDE